MFRFVCDVSATRITERTDVPKILNLHQYTIHVRGHALAQWLRYCAANRKVAGSIPNGVTGIFHSHNPSGRTMALGLTQPLTEMSTRNISRG
jgi:hypothetical protein